MGNNDRLLRGPDGGNPLAFLAALGTLRVSALVWPEHETRLSWTRHGTGWRPVMHTGADLLEEEFVEGLHGYLKSGRSPGAGDGPDPAEAFPYLAFDKDTAKLEPDRFAALALDAARHADEEREAADFLAAFGCEACVSDGYVEDTAFRTMSGSGRQHFLGTMLNLVAEIKPEHVRSTLLESWRYQDPIRSLSMRWDPADLNQYALQWGDPSSDPTRGKRGSMLGANRLAVEALPLFPTAPVVHRDRPALATTGFTGRGEPLFTWPLWTVPISLETCRSLLSHPLLGRLGDPGTETGDRTRARRELNRMGVAEIFQSRRISDRYFRNFSPPRAV